MNDLDLNNLKNSAVELAIAGKYQEAIDINMQILEENENDTDIIMQLGHAYWQIGELKKAKKYYRKALDIDPNNSLAIKKISLLNAVKQNKNLKPSEKKAKIVPITELIEEPGTTKIVKLSIVGKPEHLSLLTIGEEVLLKIRKRKIEVRDINGNYVGCLPDDLSKRIIQFIQYKTKYEAYVFSIDKNEVKIFIREVKKPKRLSNTATFTSEEFVPISTKKSTKSSKKVAKLDKDDLSPEAVINKEVESDKKEKANEEDEEGKIYQEYEE